MMGAALGQPVIACGIDIAGWDGAMRSLTQLQRRDCSTLLPDSLPESTNGEPILVLYG